MRIAVLLSWLIATSCGVAQDSQDLPLPEHVSSFVSQFCLDCHDASAATADLDLPGISRGPVTRRLTDRWEDVVRRLDARQMPPPDADLPSEQEYEQVVKALGDWLDALDEKRPNPGRTSTLRRLTRTEYQNAIRDLLGVEIDASQLLPPDQSSHGFDNITVGELSPTLLNRYLTAAQRISRSAIGVSETDVRVQTFRVRPDQTQEYHVPGLPLGTRGGTLIDHVFTQSGEYEVQVLLTRDRNEEVEGLYEPHQIQVLLDRRVAAEFTVKPPPGRRNFQIVDAGLKSRLHVSAGRHRLGVTFPRKAASLEDTKRQPYLAHFNMHRHPRLGPAVYQVTVTGPFQPSGVGNTQSRQTVYGEHLDSAGQLSIELGKQLELDEALATRIIGRLLRRAFRRPVDGDDLRVPMRFFRDAYGPLTSKSVDGTQAPDHRRRFELGIESALASILVNPNFLFRLESLPKDAKPATPYKVSDIELASRLSFLLWSSLPDDELLMIAEQGRLRERDVLKSQVRRMLADDRSAALATNFASQWLHLRNLESITPDLRQFPDFDDNLRQAMRRETELLFESVVNDDLSAVQLLSADYTFLDERLAKHYSIPHVYGNRFRRVELAGTENRGGLLRQASILTVTSYATRTSPVIRGHWILENLLGSPPPPPPANVPTLRENTVNASLPIRERLVAHRADPACAGCHAMMDPIGFSLENFDAIGRWRERDSDIPIDAAGNWGNQGDFDGVDGLEIALLKRPELFVGTLTEKLLTFGLGRGIENSDAPAIRRIVRHAKMDDYRFSSLILAIVESPPFQMRMSP